MQEKVILASTKNNMVAVNIADNEFIILSYKTVLHIEMRMVNPTKKYCFITSQKYIWRKQLQHKQVGTMGLEPQYSIQSLQLSNWLITSLLQASIHPSIVKYIEKTSKLYLIIHQIVCKINRCVDLVVTLYIYNICYDININNS